MGNFETFILILLSALTLSECLGIPLKHGYRLDGSTQLTKLIKSSAKNCHQSCMARKRCKSFHVDRRSNLCYLSSSDSSTPGNYLTIAPGFVYSEKSEWSQTSLGQVCENDCGTSETCNPLDTNTTCAQTECGEPQLMDSNSEIFGSLRNIGARVSHVCTNNPNIYNTSVCLPSGQWSNVSLTCTGCGNPPAIANGKFMEDTLGVFDRGATATIQCNAGFKPSPQSGLQIVCLDTDVWELHNEACEPVVISSSVLASNLSTSPYRIMNCGYNKYWHFNGLGRLPREVSVKHQVNDNYCNFQFEKQIDGSYLIKNPHTSIYIRDDDGSYNCRCLNGKADMAEKRFWIYVEPSGEYSIISRATGRYVRVDEDNYVTSKYNKADIFALFFLRPV